VLVVLDYSQGNYLLIDNKSKKEIIISTETASGVFPKFNKHVIITKSPNDDSYPRL